MNIFSLTNFSTSATPPKILEAIFTKRHALLQSLARKYEAVLREKTVSHTMIYGPRGIGKTHLISLLNYKLEKKIPADSYILWFEEEEWEITSYPTFVFRVLDILNSKYHLDLGRDIQQFREIVATNKKNGLRLATNKAVRLLLNITNNKPLLLIAENIDLILENFGKEGIKKLKDLFKAQKYTSLIAASSKNFNKEYFIGKPLDNFFSSFHQLSQFHINEAQDLLAKSARLSENHHLETFINSGEGLKRIKAIHFLAGGNPRIYTILFSVLSETDGEKINEISLDRFFQFVVKTFDALTPYYQAIMLELPPLQRRIIRYICSMERGVTVTEIHKHCLTSQNSVSTQLIELKNLGYLEAEKIGREVFYDLKESLMRFTLGLKSTNSSSLKLFISFLKSWFTEKELSEHLVKCNREENNFVRDQISDDLNNSKYQSQSQNITCLISDYLNEVKKSDYTAALKINNILTHEEPNNPDHWLRKGHCFLMLGDLDNAKDMIEKSTSISGRDYNAWRLHGDVMAELNELEKSEKSYRRALKLFNKDIESLINLGVVLDAQNRQKEASYYYNERLKIPATDSWELINKGIAFCNLYHWQNAYDAFTHAIDIGDKSSKAYHYRAKSLRNLERYKESLDDYNAALEKDKENPKIWKYRFLPLIKLGLYDDALDTCNNAINLVDADQEMSMPIKSKPKHASINFAWRGKIGSMDTRIQKDPIIIEVYVWKAIAQYLLGDAKKSLDTINHALSIDSTFEDALMNKKIALMCLGEYEDAHDIYSKLKTKKNTFFNASNHSLLLYLSGDFDEGNRILENALLSLKPPISKNQLHMVYNLLLCTGSRDKWGHIISLWIKLFSEKDMTASLGMGLIESIRVMSSTSITNDSAKKWYALWETHSSEHQEMNEALRLLNAAVEFKTSGKRSALWVLPSVERKLLDQLTINYGK